MQYYSAVEIVTHNKIIFLQLKQFVWVIFNVIFLFSRGKGCYKSVFLHSYYVRQMAFRENLSKESVGVISK